MSEKEHDCGKLFKALVLDEIQTWNHSQEYVEMEEFSDNHP